MTAVSHRSDESQLAVVEADPDARLIVTAAAGQGKTHVVIERLRFLEEEGYDVGQEVLVLSFSRAAVEVMRSRGDEGDLPPLAVKTFDAFAAELNDAYGDGRFHGYEDSIRRATEVIDSGETDLADLAHVIVDEVQDLVGDRAAFVLAILRAADHAGFTLLGDPLQGIYDFQLDTSAAGALTSTRFLDIVRTELGADDVGLAGHYRARTSRMRGLPEVGDRIRALSPDEAATGHRLLDEFREAPRCVVSDIMSLEGYLEVDGDEPTGVLANTNFELLELSERLHEQGIAHVVRRRSEDRGYAAWIATVFAELTGTRIQESEFRDHAADQVPALQDPDVAWRSFKEIEGDRRDHTALDLPRLARGMRQRTPPAALAADDAHPLTLSTVHRSKGLEYDVVIHLDPRPDHGSEATLERLRTKYVASSRARDELFIVRDPKDRRRRGSKAGGRWVERTFGRGRRPYIARFELLPQDFRPVPLVRAVSANADLVGYAVTAHRPDSDDPRPFVEYTASIDGAEVVGKSTEAFADFVCQHVIGARDITADRFPPAFKGMRVSAVETMAKAPDDDADSPLFVHVARIGGFARAVWRPTEEETQET